MTSKQDKAAADADKAAVDTRNDGSHATAATQVGTSNLARREASPATDDAMTAPTQNHGVPVYPSGNPALANAILAENQDHAAAAGNAKPYPRDPDELQSHRLGVTPETEARAVRPVSKEDEDEAKRLQAAEAEARQARIAEGVDILKAAAR